MVCRELGNRLSFLYIAGKLLQKRKRQDKSQKRK
nr:MAG TPA: hypothetical protein [Caudoviricetes sp.]